MVHAYGVVGGDSSVLGGAATGVFDVCLSAAARSRVAGIHHFIVVVAGAGVVVVDMRVLAAFAACVVLGDGGLLVVPLLWGLACGGGGRR